MEGLLVSNSTLQRCVRAIELGASHHSTLQYVKVCQEEEEKEEERAEV